jgi:hypothetical protein
MKPPGEASSKLTSVWTTPGDLKAQVYKLWESGSLLSCMLTDERKFPLKMRFRGPSSDEISQNFDEVRIWVSALRDMPHCRLEMREVRHRVIGKNSLPAAIWLDDSEAAVSLIGKKKEATRFAELVAMTRLRQPELLHWLAKRPLVALSLHDRWIQLLDVVGWLLANPRPNIYLRQVDIVAVHSKFIEEHRGVLSELFECVLPDECIDRNYSGATGFARRYGFRDKPQRIRFRILDASRALLPVPATGGEQDVALDCQTFALIDPAVDHVFIVENEINFLSFPPLPRSVVIFGAGYGLESLVEATWLTRCALYYWGDIDTHGYAILNSARKCFPHVQSILMDEATLVAHLDLSVNEDKPHSAQRLPLLTAEEQSVYEGLKTLRWSKCLRLEQERIAWSWALPRIKCCTLSTTPSE